MNPTRPKYELDPSAIVLTAVVVASWLVGAVVALALAWSPRTALREVVLYGQTDRSAQIPVTSSETADHGHMPG